MKKLKVVQIGTGHDHSFAPINSLKKRDDVDFLGYVRVNEDTKTFDGVAELSYEEVLNLKDLDAVFIETEDKYLTDYAYEFIKRGIPVQMDKPGGQDKESFDRLFDLAKEKNITLHLGYMYRYNPAIKKAIQMVKTGELGKIYCVEAQMSCYHSEKKRKWLEDYKGGMMNFLGCHLIDLLLQIKGIPDEIIPFNVASDKTVGQDIGFAVFLYNGIPSFVKSVGVELNGFSRRNIIVCGEKGTIEITPTEEYINGGILRTPMRTTLLKDKGSFNLDGGVSETKYFELPDRYDEMYDEFFKIIRGEIENPYDYEYEKTLHDVILKACGCK